MLITAILAAMETCLNQVLQLDARTRNKLETVSGKTLGIICELPGFALTVLVSNDRIILRQGADNDANVTIKGRASALLKLLVTKNTAGLHDDGVIITGNISLLTVLQKLFQEMDIDWEYQLSRFIGDIPTQAISDSLNATGRLAERTGKNLQQDIDDYLHVEKKVFPSKTELARFYASIDELRLRVDRLSSRINRLQSL